MESTASPAGQKPRSIIRDMTFGLAMIVGLVLTLAIFVISAMNYITAREVDIRDDFEPRLVANEAIRSAMTEQEAALRGYAITADDQFLDAFFDGRNRYLAARATLETHRPFNDTLEEMRRVEFAAADAWYENTGLPTIEQVRESGEPITNATTALQESKRSIDVFRLTHDAYQKALDDRVSDAATSVGNARRTVDVLALLISILIVALTSFLSWNIHKAIRQPLDTLGGEVAAIDAGARARRVPALTATEFDQLGRGINRMLDNLDASIQESESQQRRLAAIVESANDGIVVISAEGLITTINPAAARMFGVSAETATGSPASELGLFTRQDVALGLDRVGGVRGDSQPIIRRFGDVVLSAVVSPLGSSTNPSRREDRGWVCVIRDVTELTRIDEMKNEFISVVSHELRTPLTAIKGFTDLILEGEAGEVTESQREFLEIVQSNSDRLVALINDMLDISRIESGRISLSLDDVFVPDVIDHALTALRPLINEKQLNVRTEIADDLAPIIGDAGRLLQILTNLVSNACKYTQASGWITVSAEPLDNLVAVSVSDTGIGIPPDALPRVFSKFYRVDQAAAREVGGTGLGLAITKSLVEMHGGRITIASRPAVGTTVRFTLPTVRHSDLNEDSPGRFPSANPNVLIVTFDDERRAAWATALRQIPASAILPKSLAMAAIVAETEYHEPCAIVLDAESGIDAESLVSELSAIDEHGVPTVVLVGSSESIVDNRIVVVQSTPSNDQLAALVEAVIPASAGTPQHRGRVLVAEDDLVAASWMRRLLSNHGFEVLVVHDGLSAVVRAIETLPDIVILDVNMPKMGATDVLPQLRGNPGTRDIPIIVMSGTLPDSRPYFVEAGASDFFAKPIDGEALVNRLIDLRKR